MEEIVLPAPAKINLALKVKGLRADGYHELEMIMQTIGLHDRVHLKKIAGGIRVVSSHPGLPEGSGNLAYRAAEFILEQSGIDGGVEIFIEKNIPLAAGLAGGSTDAAAVLKGISKLYQLKISDEVIREMASKLGSDVPFCLKGGTSYAYGRGEQLEQLPDLNKIHIILITPPVEVSTAFIYREYDRLKNGLEIPVSRLVEIIKQGKEINWQEGWANDLEPVTARLFNDIYEIKGILKEMGVKFSLMTGSGPTIFGILDKGEEALFIKDNWPRKEDFVFVTSTVKQEFSELW